MVVFLALLVWLAIVAWHKPWRIVCKVECIPFFAISWICRSTNWVFEGSWHVKGFSWYYWISLVALLVSLSSILLLNGQIWAVEGIVSFEPNGFFPFCPSAWPTWPPRTNVWTRRRTCSSNLFSLKRRNLNGKGRKEWRFCYSTTFTLMRVSRRFRNIDVFGL